MRKYSQGRSKKMPKWGFIKVIENNTVINSFELDEKEKLTVKFPKMKPRKLIFEMPKLKNSMASPGAQFHPPVESQPTTGCFNGKESDNNNSLPLNNENDSKSFVFSSFEEFGNQYESFDLFKDDINIDNYFDIDQSLNLSFDNSNYLF